MGNAYKEVGKTHNNSKRKQQEQQNYETTIYTGFVDLVSVIIYFFNLYTESKISNILNSLLKQVCAESPPSAVGSQHDATLTASVCYCCTPPIAVDRYLLPAGRSAANPSTAVAAVDRWDRQTDGHR